MNDPYTVVYECPIKKMIFKNFLSFMYSYGYELIISMNFALKKYLDLSKKYVSETGFEPVSPGEAKICKVK